MVGGPSIVFTRKAIAGETKIRHTENLCKTVVGIDAFSMCQEMPTGLYTRWEIELKRKDSFPFRISDDALRTW